MSPKLPRKRLHIVLGGRGCGKTTYIATNNSLFGLNPIICDDYLCWPKKSTEVKDWYDKRLESRDLVIVIQYMGERSIRRWLSGAHEVWIHEYSLSRQFNVARLL
jgi:hypothetical protein